MQKVVTDCPAWTQDSLTLFVLDFLQSEDLIDHFLFGQRGGSSFDGRSSVTGGNTSVVLKHSKP